jgi:CBS domain-containing protein
MQRYWILLITLYEALVDVPEKIRFAARRLEEGYRVNRITVRDFLLHFGVERRGYIKVQEIRDILDSLNLKTDPDFEVAWIDEPIWLKLKRENLARRTNGDQSSKGERGADSDEMVLDGTPAAVEQAEKQSKAALISEEPGISTNSESGESILADDPTFRIGSLPAANKRLIVVNSDAPLTRAVTLMLQHDFSQLPVMQGEREVRGVVTWKSIGSRLALGQACASVQDCREDARIVDSNRTLFEAIPTIIEFGYVLVRDQQDRRITGIVTASDLSLQFQSLSEPFLLLREIELHIRLILRGKLTVDDFDLLKSQSLSNRKLQVVDELTIGQYITLFQNQQIWQKLELNIDPKEFIYLLDEVRSIRNEVMHFDRDPMTKDQLDTLKRASRFMQNLYELILSERNLE